MQNNSLFLCIVHCEDAVVCTLWMWWRCVHCGCGGGVSIGRGCGRGVFTVRGCGRDLS